MTVNDILLNEAEYNVKNYTGRGEGWRTLTSYNSSSRTFFKTLAYFLGRVSGQCRIQTLR